MNNDIYVKDTSITIAYDGMTAHVQMRFRDLDTAKLTLRLLNMFSEDVKKRIETTEQYLILQELPSVEHADYFVGYGNSNADIIGRQLDYKQLSKEDAKAVDAV